MTGSSIISFKAKDRRNIVEYFYQLESEEWHRNVHKRGGTKEENIKDTLSTISKDSIMYEVVYGGERAAFFVKYEDEKGMAIEGFHIKKSFREPWFIKEFWDMVKKVFDGDIAIGLYKKNIPAIRHVMKQGFVPIKDLMENGKIFIILKYTVKP